MKKNVLSVLSFALLLSFTFTPLQSTAGAISITAEYPSDGDRTAFLNPELSARVAHSGNKPMDIAFSMQLPDGSWHELAAFSNVKNGIYNTRTRDVRKRNETYRWRVTVNEAGNHAEREYSFDVINYVGEQTLHIADATCWKYGYIRRGHKPGRYYIATQAKYGRGGAAYDINKGWYDTFFEVPYLGHGSWGYWNGKYHIVGNIGQGGAHMPNLALVSGDNFEDFENMDRVRHALKIGSWQKASWPESSTYTFNNNRAWITGIDHNEEKGSSDVRYWEWTKEGEAEGAGWRGQGWVGPVDIGEVITHTGHATLLRADRDTWYMYLVDGKSSGASLSHSSTMQFFKTEDAGKTWSGIQDTGIPAHAMWSHVSFARYGDNYYVFLTDGGETIIYFSNDGENWQTESRRTVSPPAERSFWTNSHGTLLNQSALIYTSNKADEGYASPQFGFIVDVEEMLAKPGTPVNPAPQSGKVLPKGTSSVILEVEVKGPQTYDTAFYLEDGSFLGIDRLLKDGDIARATFSGLEPGKTYGWYAVSRGAVYQYYGEPDNTSDEAWTEIHTFTIPE